MAKAVLLVEDDPRLRRGLVALLPDYDVRSAATLTEALALLAQADLVILDLRLPDAHGLEALHALRPRTRAPIVIITGLDSVLATDAFKAGADAFVPKPFTREQLLENIEAAVRARARTNALDEAGRAARNETDRLVEAVRKPRGPA